jgi:hypothetical protein
MVQKSYTCFVTSFNFQHLDLFIILFGFNIEILTHLMKLWKFLHTKMLHAICYTWNQKVFRNKSVHIKEILAIVEF